MKCRSERKHQPLLPRTEIETQMGEGAVWKRVELTYGSVCVCCWSFISAKKDLPRHRDFERGSIWCRFSRWLLPVSVCVMRLCIKYDSCSPIRMTDGCWIDRILSFFNLSILVRSEQMVYNHHSFEIFAVLLLVDGERGEEKRGFFLIFQLTFSYVCNSLIS